MRREGRKQQHENLHDGTRLSLQRIKAFDISMSLEIAVLNRSASISSPTERMVLCIRRAISGDGSISQIRSFRPSLVISDNAPDAVKETADARHAGHLPGLGDIEWSHEHLIETHGVGTVDVDHLVRIDDVELRLRHLLDLLADRLFAGKPLAVAF